MSKNPSGVRFFSSLKVKFALSYMAVIVLALVMMNTYFLSASRDMIFSSKLAGVRSQAAIMETALRDIERLSADAVSQVVARLDLGGLSRVVVMGERGDMLYGAPDESDSVIESYLSSVLSGYDVYYSKFADGAFYVSVFAPVVRGGAVTGSVFITDIDTDQGEILMGLQNTIRSISILMLILSILLIAFILWTIMRRITSVLRAIENVREGEYNYHINMTGNDELAALGRQFDDLTDKLRETDYIRRRFVADASHELKTPLSSIKLLSDSILQNETIDESTVREFVSDIGQEAERLARTTEKLMTLTRLDGGNVEEAAVPVDLRDVVSSTLRMLAPLAEIGEITLTSSLDAGCIVLATEDSLHQVAFNLVENALKYNVPRGSVNVALIRRALETVLRVEDSGIGVPDDDLPHIFNRFYRVDKARSRSFGGSGLGLSIARDTVRAHGGKITAAPRNEGGMVFEVRFPLYTPPEA
ncbi:MAG: HAMP domain-containing histidine kinase [Clostridiales bacterium]|nr:HAMP domain-containing histidine kinase [Clostridiales bacterium]